VPEIVGQLFGIAVIASLIRAFVPLFLATLGGLFNERSGIVNIGIDGMMIFGTWFGAWGSLRYGPVAGLLVATLSGILVAAIHAVATVTFRVDQIVSGVAINILALGVPRFLSIVAFGEGQEAQSPAVRSLPKIDLPGLGAISPVVILTIVLGVGAWWVFNRTVLGLRLRSAGENPRAAESLGVRVVSMRYAGVLISGAFAGLAGGYLSIELVGQYTEGMNVYLRVDWINNDFIASLPYIVTLVVLAVFSRRVRPPKAVGQAYEAGSPV
jgi:simple sugar transport system permease protein